MLIAQKLESMTALWYIEKDMRMDTRQRSSPEAKDGELGLARGGFEIVCQMREAIASGKPWHIALLEAIGLWILPQEEWEGRPYRYLLRQEAFDWLLLAERLCGELNGALPASECERLLFYGQLPEELTASQLKELIGVNKYRTMLNFWYGVVVEEALQLAVEEEVRKEERGKGHPDSEHFEEEASQRLYGDGRIELLKEFRHQAGYKDRHHTDLTELREFTYWLFRLRLDKWDPARVASDTRKGLGRLYQLRGSPTPH